MLRLTWLTLIPNHSIRSTICDIEVLERKRASVVLIKQNLEVIIIVRLLVVRRVVLKREDSRRRRAIHFVVDTLGSSLVDIQICPERH